MGFKSNDEIIKERIEGEKQGLGGEILDALNEMIHGDLESLRLYYGLPEDTVRLHGAWAEHGGTCYYGSWLLDEEGLFYEVEVSDEEEFYAGVGYDRCLMRRGRRPMSEPSDFVGIPMESVRGFHRLVRRDDFLDQLAWRFSREGKPGFREGGFDEERETWRVKSADPSEVHDLLRRSRRK